MIFKCSSGERAMISKTLIVTGVVAVVLGSGYTENVLDVGEQKKNKEYLFHFSCFFSAFNHVTNGEHGFIALRGDYFC